ncbi:hypothetical protein HaLaN_03124 [Haematococcus lacustris]|uniref:Uncharacterized protein n=1 Tax=Haematococcus lacustris TaxID=44745 RepID=A0A699YJU5_HAELA|nr:hypothetical protein HaLaN_03124 [Haematococcus lacustris]
MVTLTAWSQVQAVSGGWAAAGPAPALRLSPYSSLRLSVVSGPPPSSLAYSAVEALRIELDLTARSTNGPGGQPLPLLGDSFADFEVLWPGQEAMSRTVEVVVIVVAALSLAVVAGLLAALTVLLMRRHNHKVAPSPSGPTAPDPLLPAPTPPAAEAPSSPAGKGSPLLSAGRAAQGPLSDFDAIASLERAASPWALNTPRLPASRLPPLYYTPGSLLHGPQLAGQEAWTPYPPRHALYS